MRIAIFKTMSQEVKTQKEKERGGKKRRRRRRLGRKKRFPVDKQLVL